MATDSNMTTLSTINSLLKNPVINHYRVKLLLELQHSNSYQCISNRKMGRMECTSTENRLRVDLGAAEDGERRNWDDGRGLSRRRRWRGGIVGTKN